MVGRWVGECIVASPVFEKIIIIIKKERKNELFRKWDEWVDFSWAVHRKDTNKHKKAEEPNILSFFISTNLISE